ncbi:MAG TPA: hypothetical protein VKQ28_09415 [Candidatus Acidoferrum sp.]|nr:hypothetical protein [Candidatus Acidoferrum sp.]
MSRNHIAWRKVANMQPRARRFAFPEDAKVKAQPAAPEHNT